MTTGSGLYINPTEKDPIKQNTIMRQLIEGRSNAVGIVTLTGDGVATSTTVKAINCGPRSAVLLTPATAHAAGWGGGSVYVSQANVTKGQFIISHAATSQTDQTFWWACFG